MFNILIVFLATDIQVGFVKRKSDDGGLLYECRCDHDCVTILRYYV